MSILFINGPAGSGKDTIANHILKFKTFEYIPIKEKLSFKEPLIKLMLDFFKIDIGLEEFMNIYYTRETKELPTELLRVGDTILSPRQALIHISENVIKPTFGKDTFGRLMKDYINVLGSPNYVFSDSGFLHEMIPLVERQDCYLARISREGTSFKNDSRSYIDPSDAIRNGINYLGDFENNSTVDEVANKIMKSFTAMVRNYESERKLAISQYNLDINCKF